VSIATGPVHGVQIAEALGIPTEGLRRFTLHVRYGDVVQVRAVYLLKDGDKVVEQIKRLHLEAKQ
jgi:hypothetical protein